MKQNNKTNSLSSTEKVEKKLPLQKNLNRSMLSKIIYGMVTISTLSVVISGMLLSQTNKNEQPLSQAAAVYTCPTG